ncbi:MAG: oxidoreductase [Burkholderiaceae bacterium]|nr:MAG: oxidoreductase [Burkholderiaceae bacterium]
MFKAIVLRKENPDATFIATIEHLDDAHLPDGDVTVRIAYSTLNYKDALAVANRSPVVRAWPMVPGIDLAGIVETSSHPRIKAGDAVLINGFGLGETHWGGLAQRARISGDWLTPLPINLSARQAMAIGTAGYTAMLSLMALEQHGVTPERGEVLVTGATGGVGSIATALLAGRGYRVVAATGKLEQTAYLLGLGASEIISRSALSGAGKPLQKERWAGVIDTVGSHTLANACAQCLPDAAVAACGLAQGMDFQATVAPFILRGVTLCGINSVYASHNRRGIAWQRLATELDMQELESMTREIALADVFKAAEELLAGQLRGRLVVNVNA